MRLSRKLATTVRSVCTCALYVYTLNHVAFCADLVAVAPGDGTFPDYKCPLDALNIELECNLREAMTYLHPDNNPDPGYTNIRLKTHDSESPEFKYMWDQTRAMVIDYDLIINTGFVDHRYALIEGYDGPDHYEEEEAYYDAGFILVTETGSLHIECVKFQHFNRLVLPELAINSYPTLDSTISHGGVLSALGGSMYVVACRFYNNSAKQGGAIYVSGTENHTAQVTIASGTIFTSNYAFFSGGAVYVEASLPAIVDVGTDRLSNFVCEDYYELYEPTTDGLTLIEKDSDCGVLFENNVAGYYGGGLSVASELPPTLEYEFEVNIHQYCAFSSNSAGTDGGGLYMYYTPGVDIEGFVTWVSNEAEFGGGVYGSRMLTFELGESCVFNTNYANDCGGALYLNVAGCTNPCATGQSDGSIVYNENSAGITQGDCPVFSVVDDQSFGTSNCTFVTGTNCTPIWDDIDTSFFPVLEQASGEYTLDFQVDYSRYTIESVLREYFGWECQEAEPYGEPSSCLTDCVDHPSDYACSDEEDQCLSLPCQNGATCYDGKNEFTCDCPAGFQGPLCDINTPDCISDPCLNGATCEDGVETFTCICTSLYEGTFCETLREDVLMSSAPSPATINRRWATALFLTTLPLLVARGWL